MLPIEWRHWRHFMITWYTPFKNDFIKKHGFWLFLTDIPTDQTQLCPPWMHNRTWSHLAASCSVWSPHIVSDVCSMVNCDHARPCYGPRQAQNRLILTVCNWVIWGQWQSSSRYGWWLQPGLYIINIFRYSTPNEHVFLAVVHHLYYHLVWISCIFISNSIDATAENK